MKPSYCRLAVILAREAPKAVIFRKGPQRWVQVILWHTDTDTFETGQWFHGKIIPSWCDLSPDGSKLIYFASKQYIWKTVDPEYTEDWTAISKPPYLTALALWPGVAGGYFVDANIISLYYGRHIAPHRNHIPPQNLEILPGDWQDPNIPRLEHSGWTMIQQSVRIEPIRTKETSRFRVPGIWHKDSDDFRIVRRELGWNQKRDRPGTYEVDYTVQNIDSRAEIAIDTDTWADWDQQGRLVYVNQGRILAGKIENGTIVPQVLGDFNANKPEQIISPASARTWDIN